MARWVGNFTSLHRYGIGSWGVRIVRIEEGGEPRPGDTVEVPRSDGRRREYYLGRLVHEDSRKQVWTFATTAQEVRPITKFTRLMLEAATGGQRMSEHYRAAAMYLSDDSEGYVDDMENFIVAGDIIEESRNEVDVARADMAGDAFHLIMDVLLRCRCTNRHDDRPCPRGKCKLKCCDEHWAGMVAFNVIINHEMQLDQDVYWYESQERAEREMNRRIQAANGEIAAAAMVERRQRANQEFVLTSRRRRT